MRTGPRTAMDIERFKYPPQPHHTVHEAFCSYSRERLINKGKDCQRAWIGFNHFMRVVPPEQDISTITEEQILRFVDSRLAVGRSILTPKKELAFVAAAVRNAHRHNRIKVVPYIELPHGEHKHRRPLYPEEFRLVMSQPMSRRLRRYYRVAYWTGARAAAIEELDWSRVDFGKGLIDFNVPGRHAANKRRVSNFPIPDEAVPVLLAWRETAGKDPFVIGAGGSTYVEASYVVRELAGLKDPSLVPRHCMRKAFMTDLIERMIEEKGTARSRGGRCAHWRQPRHGAQALLRAATRAVARRGEPARELISTLLARRNT